MSEQLDGLKGSVMKLWLWKNFVNGNPEYWAFDNPFPVFADSDDPQTLGEPCGYAIFKESRNGRPDVPEEEVLRRIAASRPETENKIDGPCTEDDGCPTEVSVLKREWRRLKQLEVRHSIMTQAVGLASTLKPDMEINVSDPVGMMQQVVAHCRRDGQRLAHGAAAMSEQKQEADLREGEHEVSDFDATMTKAEWWARGRIEQLEADREKLLQLLTSASEVIGRFVSDEGWAQSDMDTMDHIDAQIASMRRAAQ